MKTLDRRLGLGSVIAISIAAMLGSGLFVLPGIAVGYTGPSVWLAYLVAGVCVLPAALSKAELATAMPESGGTYVYVDRTFGPLAGTIAGLGLWLSLLLKSGFALVGFGAYLEYFVEVPIKPVAVVVLLVVVVLNVLGVRKVGKVQSWVVVIAIAGLSVLAVRGLMTYDEARLSPLFPEGGSGFWLTVSFVYISYAGVTKVAAIAEEVEKPGRNLPVGILSSLVIVSAIYAVVTFAMVGCIPLDELGGNLHPVLTLGEKVGGVVLGVGAALLGVLTMTSMANSGLLAASRFPFAMSRNKVMPQWLSYVSGRWTTPVYSILLTASLMGVAIVFLRLEAIAKLASALMILGYTVENAAVLVLRETSVQWYRPSFRSPLYPFMQLAGVVLGVVLLAMIAGSSVIAIVVTTLCGLLLFFAYGRKAADRRGVLGRLGPRKELLVQEKSQVALPSRAPVVVPLLGKAHGAEAMAELGTELAGGSKIEVVHIRDVPEQIALDAELHDPVVTSLGRRIEKLADARRQDIEFAAVATHDHIRVVHEISRRVHCDWLVMEWQGRTERGVMAFSPLGWLVDHLSCNLALYKDVGSRYVASILAYPEPGPHDTLVTLTANHLAKVHSAELTFVRAVPVDASERAEVAELAYLDELTALCTRPVSTRIARGASQVATLANVTGEYDLLVMGAPPEARWWELIRGTAADRLMRQAACSVLRLKAPRRLVDRTVSRDGSAAAGPLQLDQLIDGECVGARLDKRSKQALFSHFAQSLSRAVGGVTAEAVETALWDRERAQNTALGRGLAVPHAMLSDVDGSLVGVFTTKTPVDYRAPDGGPVDVFFVTLGPPSERNTQLSLLSTLAWLVDEARFLESLRSADNDNELMAVLLATSTLNPKPRTTPPPEVESRDQEPTGSD